MKRWLSLLVSLLLLATLSACNGNSKGPTADTKCVGGTSSTSSSSAVSSLTGSGSNSGSDTASKIDAALRNCKIITTIVNKVKAEVIGQGASGFGDPSSSGSSDGSSTNSSCSVNIGSSSDTGSNVGAEGIYQAFATSPEFEGAIGAAFTLYVIFYGIALATGMADARAGDALIKILKLAAVAALATSWGFFYQVIGNFFINGTDEIIGYFLDVFKKYYVMQSLQNGSAGSLLDQVGQNPGLASNNIFTFLDSFIASVFSYQTYAFVAALFNAGPYAPVYGAILMMSLFWVLQGIIKVVSVYIFSLFAKALLFAVAPLFITFLLFKRTEDLFNAWVKQLVSFSLQPILIMAFVGLFAQLLSPFFTEFATYKICWFQLQDADNKYGWKFAQPGTTTQTANDPGVNSAPPIGLQSVLLFAFFAWLFLSALKMVDSMVIAISQSQAAGNISQLLALNQFTQSEGNDLGGNLKAPKR